MKLKSIWWRRITNNDYFNIEKVPPSGPRGQLHIDVPAVASLRRFFGLAPTTDPNKWRAIEVVAGCLASPGDRSRLEFRPRPKNDRYDIPMQNIHVDSSMRHPAWTPKMGWPTPSTPVASTADAAQYVNEGIAIFLARDSDGEIFAGFLLGSDRRQLSPRLRGVFDKPAGDILDLNNDESEQIVRCVINRANDILDVSNSPTTEESDPESPTREGGTSAPRRRTSGGQGIGLNAEERKAVEKHAVGLAIAHFELHGFHDIDDVGLRESYDLKMTRGGVVYVVEVKGTTTIGTSVLLTTNEVDVHRRAHPNNALVVVSEIVLSKGPPPTCEGGLLRCYLPWKINDDGLAPLTFKYSLENQDS